MLNFPVHIPFAEMLGFKLLRFEGGEAEVAFEMRDDMLNSWSVIHGGVTMTLLDVALAHAARAPDPGVAEPNFPGLATVEMKTSFMRPALGTQTARARLLHRTASLAFCEGSVFASNGELVAHATGTFKYLRGLPTGDRAVHRLNARKAADA